MNITFRVFAGDDIPLRSMCICSATEFTSGAGTSDSAGRQRVSEPRVDGHRGACATTGEKLLAKPLDQGQSGVDSCSSIMIIFCHSLQ